MGTTPLGLRYPEVTDRVADGANAIRRLAEDVNSTFLDRAAAAGTYLPVFHPHQYGPMGTSDDSATLAAAFAAASAAGGGVVQLPPGVTRGIAVLPSKCVLRGHGRASVLKAPNGAAVDVVSLTSNAYGFGIRDLVVDGNLGSISGGGHGLYLTTFGGVLTGGKDNYGGLSDPVPLIQNVVVQNVNGTGVFLGENMREIRLIDVYIAFCKDVGLDNDAADTFLTNVTASGTRNEGIIDRRGGGHYVGCKVFYAGFDPLTEGEVLGRGHGFRMKSKGSVMVGCQSQDNSETGVFLDGSEGPVTEVVISGMLFDGNRDSAVRLAGPVRDCLVTGANHTTSGRYATSLNTVVVDGPETARNRIHVTPGTGQAAGRSPVLVSGGATLDKDDVNTDVALSTVPVGGCVTVPVLSGAAQTTGTWAVTAAAGAFFGGYAINNSNNSGDLIAWKAATPSGSYSVHVFATRGPDAGTIHVFINDQFVTGLNLYSSTVQHTRFEVLNVALTGTRHHVDVRVVSKDSSSTAYLARVSGITLTRTG